jgi:hypothetical protein
VAETPGRFISARNTREIDKANHTLQVSSNLPPPCYEFLPA